MTRDAHDDFDGSQVIETATMVLFWQPPAVFGQWTASEFVVDGVTYRCAEQFMMAEKARLFGADDPRIHERAQWCGQNLLGEALMRVRAELRGP